MMHDPDLTAKVHCTAGVLSVVAISEVLSLEFAGDDGRLFQVVISAGEAERLAKALLFAHEIAKSS